MKNLKEYIVNENNFFKNLGIGQEVLIKKWLDKYKITNYTINKDLTINVYEVVCIILDKHDEYLPEYIQFNNVDCDFCIAGENLKSLRGCPKNISYTGGFSCSGCPELTSLEGCPDNVDWFSCSYCKKLKNLKGAPSYVRGVFDCSECESLTSLKGCPEYVENFKCDGCKSLKSLKGCPKKCK